MDVILKSKGFLEELRFKRRCNLFKILLIEDVRKDKGMNVISLQNRRVLNYGDLREDGYKRLAEVVRTNLDMERIYEITGLLTIRRHRDIKKRR